MKSLLTDPGVIEVDQHSIEGHLLGREGDVVAWVAVSENRDRNYLALFNLGDGLVHVDKTFAQYGFMDRAEYKVRDLWMRKELGGSECGDGRSAGAWGDVVGVHE